MRNDKILELLGMVEHNEEVCDLVNKLIVVTQDTELSFDYLKSLVGKISKISGVKEDMIFKKFVQYPYYNLFNQYKTISSMQEESISGQFIFSNEQEYEYDSFIHPVNYLEDFINYSIKMDNRVSAGVLLEILSRVNVKKKHFSLIELVKELIAESGYEHITVLEYLEDIYDDISFNGYNIDDYYIVVDGNKYSVIKI